MAPDNTRNRGARDSERMPYRSTLPGFSTAKHENVELTSDFTAQVNVELKVGSLELTVNVAPRTPVVDVQGSPSGPS